jgi:hypothetical protein
VQENPVFVVALIISLVALLLWKLPQWQVAAVSEVKARIDLESKSRQTLAQIIGGAAFLLGLYLSAQTLWTTQEGQITDRFTKAIGQLGEDHNLAIRMGGIYGLKRIANDSGKDYWPIMEIFAAYVREHARWKSQMNRDWKVDSLPIDIITVRSIISDRRPARWRPDLRGIDLRGEKLGGIHLEGAILSDAHLEEAYLAQAHLESASLNEAYLERAVLWGAHLEGAGLWGAHLEGAALSTAHFNEAKLLGAYLNKAIFNDVTTLQGADISFADFREAQGLTISHIKAARNWRDAFYSMDLLIKLELPPDNNEKVQRHFMDMGGVSILRRALGGY